MDRAQLLQQLPRPAFKKVRISGSQTAQQIIKEIRAAHRLYAGHYKRIAEPFRGATAKQTARKVWDFLKRHISYAIESRAWQSSKSPAMLLTDGKGDCKHYSLFTAGILSALGYQCVFGFAGYKPGNPTPQHVYVLVRLENGELMPVDAVINQFGEEKPYVFKQDYSTENKMLYRISGIIGDAQMGRNPRRVAKRAARRQKRAQRRAQGKGFFRKIGRGLAKAALTPARNAYLVLLGLNFKGMAKRLNQAIKKDPQKVKNLWVGKFKGSWKALLKNIARGSGKGQKFTPAQISGMIGYLDQGLGAAAAPLAATLAAAAPIMIAVFSLLKEILGAKQAAEEKQTAQEATGELAKNPRPDPKDINDSVERLENQSQQLDNSATSANQPDDNADGTPAPAVKADSNMILIGVAALAALALASKKK